VALSSGLGVPPLVEASLFLLACISAHFQVVLSSSRKPV
jgi:hypothetical protein